MPYAWILVALLGLGCSKEKEKIPPTEPPKADAQTGAPQAERAPAVADPDPFPALGAEPVLEVQSAGQAPRETLRWKFAEGSKYRLQVRSQETMRMDMELGGEELAALAKPPIVYQLSLEIRGVDEDGTARVAFRIAHAGAEKSSAVSKEELELMKRELRALRGLQGTYSVDARGFLRDIELERDSAPAKQASLDKLSRMLRWTAVPLPGDEVGKGAVWTVKQSVLQDGATVHQLSTLEMHEIAGSRIELAVNVDQSAADSHKPSSATGAETYELSQLTSKESLHTQVDLNHLVPIASEVEGKLEMATRADGPDGAVQDVQVSMGLRGSLRGRLVTD